MTIHTRRDFLKTAAAGATVLTFAGTVSGAGGTTQYVVAGRNGGVERRLSKAGFRVLHSLSGTNVYVVEGRSDPAGVRGVTDAVPNIRFRRVRPELELSEADVDPSEVPTDDETFYPYQWDKMTTDVPTAHETTMGDGSIIAIIDSGIDIDHPDLAPNLAPGALFRFAGPEVGAPGTPGFYPASATGVEVRIPTTPVADHVPVRDVDGNIVGYPPSYFDIVNDWRVDDDVDGHGSHCAGIAAACVGEPVPGFGTGIAGMAPGATLVPHRVFYWILEDVTYETDSGEVTQTLVNQYTSFADILSAIDFAANTVHADSMNLSIGTAPIPPQFNADPTRRITNLVVRDAVNAGSVVVISAGNAGTEMTRGLFTLPTSVPGAMRIAATGPNDEMVFYSNYGNSEITLGAPGGGYETLEKTLASDTPWPFPLNLVLSTVPPDIYGGAYAWFAGTSMAAPQVAGVAALVAAANPDLNANQIERAIVNGAEKATGSKKREVGAGVLNAAGAVEEATK
jgi:subtilisin family serine protease